MAKRKGKKAGAPDLSPTLWSDLEAGSPRNVYCRQADLVNEASVEQFFASRMLQDLGYRDRQIKPKESLDAVVVGLGHKRAKYKPDYVLMVGNLPRCVIDAKSTDEDIEDWTAQCSGYCLWLNQQYETQDPVRYYVLTNGLKTNVYEWNKAKPVETLTFADFAWGNPKYERFKALLGAKAIAEQAVPEQPAAAPTFSFERPSRERARQLFATCHTAIWKAEVAMPSFAFLEFVKVMFVKLWLDRQLRENPETKGLFDGTGKAVELPADAVVFSVGWIEKREKEGVTNPVDATLFATLRDIIEENIVLSKKKRLFDRGERIRLKSETIKDVVRRLQHFDLYGIDEDLNGRLFETFLSATMRGPALGQFFTPRSVVKMMTRLAGLQASREHTSMVLDGCCGSGGFLIESLTVMRNAVRRNTSLTKGEQADLLETVCNKSIYGVDLGKDPPLARIARINMYLHMDGGSRIYYADALDKELDVTGEKDPEIVQNTAELRADLRNGAKFDVVLTNPPSP